MRTFRVVAIVVAFLPAGLVPGPASARQGPPTPRSHWSPQVAVDWPQFRFDDRHSGVNPLETTISKKNAQFLSLSWQAQLGDLVDFSSPVVVNGVVYIRTIDGPLWTGATGGAIEPTATVGGGVVYVGSDDGTLYAFDAAGCGAAKCRALWTGNLGSSVFESTPALANGMVYLGSQHNVAAFDAAGCGAKECNPIWQAPNDDEFYGGSPAVTGRRVYIGLESGLAAFDANGCGQSSCDPLWTGFGEGAQAAVLSSPTVANGVVYAGRNTGEILAWKASGCGASFCTQIWKGFTEESIVTSSPTVVNGKVYIGSADNRFPENISGRIYVWELS